MRILAAFGSLLLALAVLTGPGFAAAIGDGAATGDAAAPTPPAATTPADPEKASRDARLDEFFQTLQSTKDQVAAKEAENNIIELWLESGSDTVDLLMSWTLQAVEAKNYALALDYLDRITTMKPDFAEGWNKRATVYFLMNDYSKSIADIGHALALEPRHFGALSGLGTIMQEIGDPKRAIDAFKRALAIDPYLDKVQQALDELQKKAAGRDI